MQTTSNSFSCDGFNDLRNRDVVKGEYYCKPSEESPGSLGTNDGTSSPGNNSRNAAATTFNPDMPTYSVFGFIAFLFML